MCICRLENRDFLHFTVNQSLKVVKTVHVLKREICCLLLLVFFQINVRNCLRVSERACVCPSMRGTYTYFQQQRMSHESPDLLWYHQNENKQTAVVPLTLLLAE